MDASAAGGITIIEAAPPQGDVIFMSCDSAGTPGALNTAVLESLNLTTRVIPTARDLAQGYAIVSIGGNLLCFVVTVGLKMDTDEALFVNLTSALNDFRITRASSLWLPLMGMGSGGLSLDQSLQVTRRALEATRWAERPGVGVVISTPEVEARPSPPPLGAKAPADGGAAPSRSRPPRDRVSVNASVFYANPDQRNADWLMALETGKILFWIKNGQPHLLRFRRGHTVVLLSGEEGGRGAIVAVGVLAAGPEREFTDNQGRRRWPVLITQVFDRNLFPRARVEAQAGPLLKSAGGGVHAIDSAQAAILSRALGEAGVPSIPLSDIDAEGALAAGETIDAALRRHPHIGPQPPPDATFDGASDYLTDAPAEEVDLLERGSLALALARRLHLIWCKRNRIGSSADDPPDGRSGRGGGGDDTFIIHVDAPWGGGKTTFANFVARALNPRGAKVAADHFLYGQLGLKAGDQPPEKASFDGIFLGDYSATTWEPHPREGRRPWIIVRSNAWRYQDVEPPWWQIYLDVAKAVRDGMLEDFRHCAKVLIASRATPSERLRALVGMTRALGRWGWALVLGLVYRITNTRLIKQLAWTALAGGGVWFLLTIIPLTASACPTALPNCTPGRVLGGMTLDDFKKMAELVMLGLTLLGGGLVTLGSALSQSLAPDIDFSGETRRVGVGDPIARFRRTIQGILAVGRRPILLIVDDLDRCPPKMVVEMLRGFQTILQSPRMFVMILGDRNWIETAHSVAHADMGSLAVGPETKLGARFVEKIFQLSFVLPAMTPESRALFTLKQVGGRKHDYPLPSPPPAPNAATQAVEAVLTGGGSASEQEQVLKTVLEEQEALGEDIEAARVAASSGVTQATNSDAALTQRVEKVLGGLAPLLPNNPRQIKRVINAFPLFATVGAQYFQYEQPGPLSTTESTSRWRQLALWVALSTEWPDTWRKLARSPLLLDAAYGSSAEAKAAMKALTDGEDKNGKAAVEAEVKRLRADPALARLLGVCELKDPTSASTLFAKTRVEPDAVRQFNRIIWEHGFELAE
ncbi:P-loop NTPase fold protein [Caulobacter sp. RHG1]|uniref:P-loop NTPase fold protein n=1 Tax=Caulobacter sp. (strain RHG1) TaxID=2545762 RepID=UPI0015555DE7|nr:P-loop NTPase fold protein [Caulobacter sp. RHG1]NQE60984.1 hypothetical protein [Caulobacter sp. RHG1]